MQKILKIFNSLLRLQLHLVSLQLQDLYHLLNENYVEDDDNMFRWAYVNFYPVNLESSMLDASVHSYGNFCQIHALVWAC